MPNIFSGNVGRVAQVEGQGLPLIIRIGNPAAPDIYGAWRGFTVFKSILTGLGLQQQSGFQVLHTLNQFIYVYSFGERCADLTFNGLSFIANCQDRITDNNGQIINKSGLEHVVYFYRQNRLSTNGLSMSISIGTYLALTGFLVMLKSSITDPSTGVSEFIMQFKVAPTTPIGQKLKDKDKADKGLVVGPNGIGKPGPNAGDIVVNLGLPQNGQASSTAAGSDSGTGTTSSTDNGTGPDSDIPPIPVKTTLNSSVSIPLLNVQGITNFAPSMALAN